MNCKCSQSGTKRQRGCNLNLEAEAARQQAEQEAVTQARLTFEAQAMRRVQGITDSPEQALARQRDAYLAEAVALGASSDAITQWYQLQATAIQEQADALRLAEEQAATAAREALQTRTLSAIYRLTNSPEQAISRRHDASLNEAQELGADTSNVQRLYQAELRQLRDQVAARAAAEAARSAAEAQRQREQAERELQRQLDGSTRPSTAAEDRVADARREFTASFASLGQALPIKLQAFRDLVEEANPSSDLFNSLIGLADQFAFITDGAKELNDSLRSRQKIFRSLREEAFVAVNGPDG